MRSRGIACDSLLQWASMGCLCSCLKGDSSSNTEATAKTPLLSGQVPGPPAHDDATSTGQSARQVRIDRKKEFLTSVEELAPVQCSKLPLPTLDKTFQDHAKLYNDLFANFRSMKDTIHNFKAKFEYETKGIPVLSDCMRLLVERVGGATLTTTRTKYSILIDYDSKEVSKRCKGPAEDTIETLELFNKANKLTKSILEKAPKVKNSVQVVLDDESGLRREISISDLSASEAPEAMKICVANINKLRKLPGSIETIQRHAQKQFNDVKEASKCLFVEP